VQEKGANSIRYGGEIGQIYSSKYLYKNINSSSDLWMSLLVMAHHREITSSSFHANWLY
jgi:hypothetical protein